MTKQREGYKRDGRYYIFCQDHYEEVNKAVYYTVMREVWREEKRQQRSFRCRDGQGLRCNKNCEECELYRLGEGPTGNDVSLDQLYEENEYEAKGSDGFENSVITRLVVDSVVQELDDIVPDAQRYVQMIIDDDLEQDVAKELGIPKTTLNYRKRKVIAYLEEHLKDLI